MGPCRTHVTAFPLGGRKIVVTCSGSDGLLFGAAPYAGYGIKIVEVGGVAHVIEAYGTAFPSIEVWQYGGAGGPELVYHYNSSGHGPSELGFPTPLPMRR
jgi:hypothetical protein